MGQKTNFSFEVSYPAQSDRSDAERRELMGKLGPELMRLLAEDDSAATVAVSDSHKGDASKLVELTTTLSDAQIAGVLQAFTTHHGVIVEALE